MDKAVAHDGDQDESVLYAVGDVHGCPRALRSLLDMILADHACRGARRLPVLMQTGDLVDRGPVSRGVLDLVLSPWMRESFDARYLRGNHEDMMLEALAHSSAVERWLHRGGAETVESYGVAFGRDGIDRVMERFRAALPPEHLRFLAATRFSHRAAGVFLCHAGVDPGVGLDAQSPVTLMETRRPFLDHRGGFGALVVHGHTPTASGFIEDRGNRVAIDAGCGHPGGRLGAAVLSRGRLVAVMHTGRVSS